MVCANPGLFQALWKRREQPQPRSHWWRWARQNCQRRQRWRWLASERHIALAMYTVKADAAAYVLNLSSELTRTLKRTSSPDRCICFCTKAIKNTLNAIVLHIVLTTLDALKARFLYRWHRSLSTWFVLMCLADSELLPAVWKPLAFRFWMPVDACP